MDESVVQPLLEALKQADPQGRDRATTQLWQLWFRQKGLVGLEILERSQRLLEAGAGEAAVALLTQLIQDQPDFAEAWNRRAVLYFTRGEYQLALEDCLRVLGLVPSTAYTNSSNRNYIFFSRGCGGRCPPEGGKAPLTLICNPNFWIGY